MSTTTTIERSVYSSSSLSGSLVPTAPIGYPLDAAPQNPIIETKTSFYQVIRHCNKFQQNVPLYEFWVAGNNRPVGHMLPEFVESMAWSPTGFIVDKNRRTVFLKPNMRKNESLLEACQRELITLCRLNVATVDGVGAWVGAWDRNQDAEHHPVQDVTAHLSGLKVPSPLRGVLGIITTGAHMNVYTLERGAMRIWVAKRAQNITYAGKLDQLVAGGMDPQDDNDALETLRREAMEEAGLAIDTQTRQVMQRDTRQVLGTVHDGPNISFFDKKGEDAGSERGQLEPGIRYTFDLCVDADVVLRPYEPDCIAGFFLWSVDRVKASLKCGEWKPNCGLVMLDFLLRHNQIAPSEDDQFDQLTTGLHRQLPFDSSRQFAAGLPSRCAVSLL